ncbi:MAG: sigma-70 family RNA polymerase sigma factor [Planctomycetes bacterium]|nr:sigma-70 family RNA polymerase sigma factor [Planctomycetota bacterium]
MRLLRCQAMAEDAVQEALILVRSQAGGFRRRGGDPEHEARAWLRRLALCRAFNLLREGRRRRRREQQVAVSDIVDEPDRIDEGQGRLLHVALSELSSRDAQVMRLVFLDELPYERVADVLGCSVATARVRAHRAVQRARRRLERRGHPTCLVPLLVLLLGDGADSAERHALRATLAIPAPSHRRRLIVAGLVLAALGLCSVMALGRSKVDGDTSDVATMIAAPLPAESTTVPIDDPELQAWIDLGRRRGHLFSRGSWWPMTDGEIGAFLDRVRCDSVMGPGDGGGYGADASSGSARVEIADEAHGVIVMDRVRQLDPSAPYRIDAAKLALCATMIGVVTDLDGGCWLTCPQSLTPACRVGETFEVIDHDGHRIATLELVDIDDEGALECHVIDGDIAGMTVGDIARRISAVIEPPHGEG